MDVNENAGASESTPSGPVTGGTPSASAPRANTEPAGFKDEISRLFDEQLAAASDESGSPLGDGGTPPGKDAETADESVESTVDSESSDPGGEPESSSGIPDKGAADVLTAPEHWPAPVRESFAKLAEMGDAGIAAQKTMLDQVKELERGANEKFSEAATARKVSERFNELVQPFKQAWALQGVDEYQGVGQLLAYYRGLSEQPVETLRYLAQQFGVEDQLFPRQYDKGAQDTSNPEIAEVRREIQNDRAQRQAEEAQRVQNQRVAEISAFKDAKGADGKLLHPHMDAVLPAMIQLAHGARAMGKVPELKDLYEQAVRMDPTLSKAPTPKPAETVADRARRAQRARSAASTNVPAGSPATPSRPAKQMTLKEELSRGYDEMAAR